VSNALLRSSARTMTWVRGQEVSNSVKDKCNCKCSTGGTSGSEGELVAEAEGGRWYKESWIYKNSRAFSVQCYRKNAAVNVCLCSENASHL